MERGVKSNFNFENDGLYEIVLQKSSTNSHTKNRHLLEDRIV